MESASHMPTFPAPHLPDEIISEILAPALDVDDDLFTQSLGTGRHSPFVRFSESPSAYLVVCKAWLRVATPLLYNVVIIRSKGQAQALAAVLSNNPLLGSFIRKLRVEGGYGASMYKVLTNAPNITDLFLAFNMYSADKTDGLCRGLERVNPRRVILDTGEYRSNNATLELGDALVAAIPKWDRFVCLDIAAAHTSLPFIPCAIAASRTLTHIVVGSCYEATSVYTHSTQCPLRILEIKSKRFEWSMFTLSYLHDLEEKFKTGGRAIELRRPADINETPRPSVSSTRNIDIMVVRKKPDPCYRPMADVAFDVQKRIWSSIFYFALSDSGWPPAWRARNRQPHNLLLVSKLFLAAGSRWVYQNVVLRSFRDWPLLARTLDSNLAYARYIHSVSLTNPSICVADQDHNAFLDALLRIVLPSLRHLKFHCAIASYCHWLFLIHGHHLITLRVSVNTLRAMRNDPGRVAGSEVSSPAASVFDLCPNLTHMTLDSSDKYSSSVATIDLLATQNAHRALHTLTFCIFYSANRDHGREWAPFFAELAARVIPRCLPTLRDVVLDAHFEWPTAERDIGRNPWVGIADDLIAAGVRVKNRNGTRWRSRLKTAGGRRTARASTQSKGSASPTQTRRLRLGTRAAGAIEG
ncbi:F-box domain-containing protein [Mycena indigotica]|uniref:F-box domain-containing protein n=1 Tax=Mycena indigotica TaxID=2126181 RepID=A0A8H6S4S1_9AGAR|nr:F-box domain-containing protein [Mycena indigotica]KAF7292031.1 F-box domain-containing protein [Mycena indigotica]